MRGRHSPLATASQTPLLCWQSIASFAVPICQSDERIRRRLLASPRSVDCHVCTERVPVQLTVACNQGTHPVCADCLGLMVSTLAQSCMLLDASGDVKCRGCTGQACEGVLKAGEVATALQENRAQQQHFLNASRRHAAEAERALRAREVEELRGRILELDARGGAEAVDAHRKLVEEELNVMRCPRCRRAAEMVDFTACMALLWPKREGGCGAAICAWCLADCGEDAHRHVANCACNPRKPSVGGTEADFRKHEAAEQRRRALAYLAHKVPAGLRRAVWDAVKGLPAIREVGLQWADVDGESASTGNGEAGGAGNGEAASSGALEPRPGSVEVSTEAQLVAAMGRGGAVELGGRTVWLTAEAAVTRADGAVTIREGTLRVASAGLAEGYALGVRNGGELRLEGVRVVGTGVQCEGGGKVVLTNVHVIDAPLSGVRVEGIGSKVELEGGRIEGPQGGCGVMCVEGGRAKSSGVEIVDCRDSGVCVSGKGSAAIVRGGRIKGAKEQHGVACYSSGCAKVRDVDIAGCKGYGTYCDGGNLSHRRCNVSGCEAGSHDSRNTAKPEPVARAGTGTETGAGAAPSARPELAPATQPKPAPAAQPKPTSAAQPKPRSAAPPQPVPVTPPKPAPVAAPADLASRLGMGSNANPAPELNPLARLTELAQELSRGAGSTPDRQRGRGAVVGDHVTETEESIAVAGMGVIARATAFAGVGGMTGMGGGMQGAFAFSSTVVGQHGAGSAVSMEVRHVSGVAGQTAAGARMIHMSSSSSSGGSQGMSVRVTTTVTNRVNGSSRVQVSSGTGTPGGGVRIEEM